MRKTWRPAGREPDHSSPARSRTPRSPARSARALYRRTEDLPKLIALWPQELASESIEARARLIAKLRKALREERRRGLGGHWTYDLARHAALLVAYRLETTELARLLNTEGPREKRGVTGAIVAVHDERASQGGRRVTRRDEMKTD